jgi:5-methylcytosine-specific restriction endonuclease McrA
MSRQNAIKFTPSEIKRIFTDDYTGKIFYNSKHWRTITKQVREKRHNECELCKSLGKVGLDFGRGLICHHIKPVRNYPELAYTLSNIQLLCLPCHDLVHRETEGENGKLLADNVTFVHLTTDKKKDKFSEDEKW